jgi:hypothetical protein
MATPSSGRDIRILTAKRNQDMGILGPQVLPLVVKNYIGLIFLSLNRYA